MWHKILVEKCELQLRVTLNGGQTFNWIQTSSNEWTSVLKGRLLTLRQEDDGISFNIIASQEKLHPSKIEEQLRDYFQLDALCLAKSYKTWAASDPLFKEKGEKFPGVRILRQDPVENLLGFICSSNNNITRISQMVGKLCSHYGDRVGSHAGQDYFTFPSLEALAKDNVESKLREMGFGYRAKYINVAAQKALELGGKEWLLSLRKLPYSEARQAILQLSGVGPKVADCVLLMSLDKPATIPVDTHVYQIACRDYKLNYVAQSSGAKRQRMSTPPKTLTPAIYAKVAGHFQTLFGEYAGWAHSVLFAADLPSFKEKKDNL